MRNMIQLDAMQILITLAEESTPNVIAKDQILYTTFNLRIRKDREQPTLSDPPNSAKDAFSELFFEIN